MEITYTGASRMETDSNYTNGASSNNTKTVAASFAAVLEKAGNITQTPNGFAYIDKYGFPHVVAAYETAARFVKQGTEVYGYNGEFAGGYAVIPNDSEKTRMVLPLPGAIAFGNGRGSEKNTVDNYDNLPTGSIAYESGEDKRAADDTDYTLSLSDFLKKYPGYITLLPPIGSKDDYWLT